MRACMILWGMYVGLFNHNYVICPKTLLDCCMFYCNNPKDWFRQVRPVVCNYTKYWDKQARVNGVEPDQMSHNTASV